MWGTPAGGGCDVGLGAAEPGTTEGAGVMEGGGAALGGGGGPCAEAGGSWSSVGGLLWDAGTAVVALSHEGPPSASSSLMNSLSLHHQSRTHTSPITAPTHQQQSSHGSRRCSSSS